MQLIDVYLFFVGQKKTAAPLWRLQGNGHLHTNTNQNHNTENTLYSSAFEQSRQWRGHSNKHYRYVFTCASMVKFSFAKSKLRPMNTTGVKLDSEHRLSLTHIWETVITLHLRTDNKKQFYWGKHGAFVVKMWCLSQLTYTLLGCWR